MCEKIGVDPLASSKGLWGEILGLGDFYYELGLVKLYRETTSMPHLLNMARCPNRRDLHGDPSKQRRFNRNGRFDPALEK